MKTIYPWQLRVVEYLSYVLAIIVPLTWNMHNRHPFVPAKSLWIAGTVSVMLFFMVWAFVTKKITVKITWLHAAIVGYFMVILVSGILGIDPVNSLFGDFSRGISVMLVGFLSLFAAFFSEIVRRKQVALRRIMIVSFWTGMVVSLMAFLGQHAFNVGWKVINASWNGSTIGNSSFLGAYLLLVLFFGFYLLVTAEGWKKKMGWAGGIVATVIGPTLFNFQILTGNSAFGEVLKNPVQLTGEAQGAVLGILVGLFVAGCAWLIMSRSRIRKIIGTGMMVAALIAGIGLTVTAVTPGTRLYDSITQVKTQSRFVYWDVAWKGFLDKPVLGWGFQNYSYVYQHHFDPIVFAVGYGRESWTDSAHSVIFEHLANTGIIGTIAYLLVYVSAVVSLVMAYRSDQSRENRWFVAIAAGLLAGYLVQNLFVFDHPAVLFVFFMWLGLVMGRIPSLAEWGFFKISPGRRWIETVIIIASLGLSGFLVAEFAILPAREASAWMTIASDLPVDEHPALRERLQDMSLMGTINDTIETDSGFYGPIRNAVTTANQQQRVVLAQEALSIVNDLGKQIKKQPHNPRAYYIAAKYLNLLSTMTTEKDERTILLSNARSYSARAIAINPRHPYFWIEAAYTELLDNQPQAAVTFVQKSFDINRADQEIYENALRLIEITKDRKLINRIMLEHAAALEELRK